MVTNRYADKLPPSALGKAVKIAKDEATKQSEKLMQDEITDSLVDDFGYTRSQATAGYRVILSRMTGLVDPAQRLETARGLAKKISVETKAWFSGEEIPAYSLGSNLEYQLDSDIEIPTNLIPMIDEALEAKGKPITDQNRKEVYILFLRGKENG